MKKENNNNRQRNKRNSQRGKMVDRTVDRNKVDASYETTKCGGSTPKSNDVRWYAKNPELLKAAASLPMSTVTGNALPFKYGESVPGVMAIDWVPSFQGLAASDAVNQAANSLYSYVVHANSRNQSYDSADLMMLIYAGAQAFSFFAHGVRAYGVVRMFDQRNKYLPEALLEAMGFNYYDLRDNISKMWFDLNELVARLGQIWIPNDLPVVERWFWLNSHVYMDSSTVKGQYYVFVPKQVYKYNETLTREGGGLSSVAGWNPTNRNTWATYMKVMNEIIDALLNSQDRGIIFGDILKAYGADKIYSVNAIDVNYVATPVYDMEVLMQIENSISCTIAAGDFRQIQGRLLHLGADYKPGEGTGAKPIAADGGNFGINQAVLNFPFKEEPTPEQIMVATRLMTLGLNAILAPGSGQSRIESYMPAVNGTEYVYVYRIFSFKGNSLNYQTVRSKSSTFKDSTLRSLHAFDHAPTLYWIDPSDLPENNAYPIAPGKTMQPNPTTVFSEFNNYTIINVETLAKMHSTAIYSELGVPVM